MLTIVAIPHPVVRATLVSAVGELRRRITVNNDVTITISRLEIGPQLLVRAFGVTSDNLVQCRHQRLVTLIFGIIFLLPFGVTSKKEYFLISCKDKVMGYSVLLWNIPEYKLQSGQVLPVYIRSNISQVYVVGIHCRGPHG